MESENAELKPELKENIETWDDMNLKEELLRGIYSYGFEKPSDIQKMSIPLIMKGGDVIAQAQSGMGKTGAFSISVLQRINVENQTTQALILAPTHELVKQIANVVRSIGGMMNGLFVKTILGGTSIQEDMAEIKNNTPQIIVGTSGRIHDMIRRKYISTADLKLFVLDEADVMLSDEFKEQIYHLFQHVTPSTNVILFSATFSDDVLELTQKFMRHPEKIVMKAEQLSLECIKQYYIAMRNDYMKYETLKDLFSTISVSQCIIYCNSIKRVIDLYDAMKKDGFAVCFIHGTMNKLDREREFASFRNGSYRVLISSNITARGIDVQHVSTVINFDIPKDMHTYLHRIGRSGRWGRKGLAVNLITKRDVQYMRNIEKYYGITIEELPNSFGEYIN